MYRLKKIFFNKGSTIAYALISTIFIIFPEEIFKSIKIFNNWSELVNIVINRSIFVTAIFLLSNILYKSYLKKRKKVFVDGHNFSIIIEYGDIFDINDGKIVINFDECYTAKIGKLPSDINKNSICGQFLTKYPNIDIKKLIKINSIKPEKEKSKYNNLDRYRSGTLIQYDNFLLMAFAKLDKNGRAYFFL